jgi:hypothetical protein
MAGIAIGALIGLAGAAVLIGLAIWLDAPRL